MADSTESSHEPAEGRLMVVVGVLGKAHGLKGEVELVTGSDDPDHLVGRAYALPDGGSLSAIGLRRHNGKLLLAFEEVTDRTGAESLRGVELRMPADERRELDEAEWWPEDVVGLSVVTVDGTELGEVVDVAMGDAQDRLVVALGGTTVEVPFVEALVPEVDLRAGRVVVDLPEGL